jgi:mono/diheme cytochrome c family protein
MPRYLIHGAIVFVVAIAALLVIRIHSARGALQERAVADGHRLAEAWCTTCHAIDLKSAGTASPAPDFPAIANQPSTTELSIKVFLRSNHRNMPNLVLDPEQTDSLAAYILSLRRN